MENKKHQQFLGVGVVFMGAGVVFLPSINSGVGAGLIIIGAVFMIKGALEKRKKK